MQDYVQLAKDFGFTDAALLPVADLVVVPAYRCFCEENLCGNYDVLPVCPPMSGTVEEMTANMRRYRTALVLTIETTPNCCTAKAEQKAVDGNEAETVGAHIALRLAEGAKGEVLLHPILVQARGRPPPACRPTASTRRRWPTLST